MNSLLTILPTLALLVIALACGPTPSGPPASPETMTPTVVPVSPTDTPTPSPAPTPTDTPIPPSPTQTPVEGPGYGGHFIDPQDDSIVYIYLVNPSQEGAEWIGRTRISRAVYKGTKKFREVRPIQGRYTYHQLHKWYKQIPEVMEYIPELTMWDLDEATNSILIGIDCELNIDRVQREVHEWLLQSTTIPVDAVRFEVTGGHMHPPGPTRFACAPPEVVDPVTGLSSPGFGGLFWESENSKSRILNVYMLEPSQKEAEELALQVWGRDALERASTIRAIQGQYTWTQLLEWHNSAKAAIRRITGTGLFSPTEDRNRLTLEIRPDQNSNIEAEIEDVLKQFGVPREAVVLLE